MQVSWGLISHCPGLGLLSTLISPPPHMGLPFIKCLLGVLGFWKGNVPCRESYMSTQQSFRSPFGSPPAIEEVLQWMTRGRTTDMLPHRRKHEALNCRLWDCVECDSPREQEMELTWVVRKGRWRFFSGSCLVLIWVGSPHSLPASPPSLTFYTVWEILQL